MQIDLAIGRIRFGCSVADGQNRPSQPTYAPSSVTAATGEDVAAGRRNQR
jgi:hypothetical protein